MKIAVILNAHRNTELVEDTIDAIRCWVTKDIVLLVDGAAWNSWGKNIPVQAYKLQGLIHNHNKAPYKNLTLGLMQAATNWPEADWYCYMEHDVLFASDKFKEELDYADKSGIWCLGNDMRTDYHKLPFLEYIIGEKLECSKYLLGCCVFYSSRFIRLLLDKGFFDRFLSYTNFFYNGYFPSYTENKGYDFGEHLYPTLAHHYGGKVGGLAFWNKKEEKWSGNFERYPMRWRPEIDKNFPLAAILHPLKELDNPIRIAHREKRKKCITQQ